MAIEIDLETPARLAELRRQIDTLDHGILGLVRARAEVVVEIFEVKGRLGLPIRDPQRERAMLEDLLRAGSWPLDQAAVRAIFRAIFRASLTLDPGLSPARAEQRREDGSRLARLHAHG